MMRRWNGLIEEYKEWLPVTDKTPALTLQEGNTPLIHLKNLSEQWGINLYVKTEGTNPTGSFKDRGMVMAVAKAKEEGKEVLICASTGNTSASAAAYGARAGMRTIVVIPEGKIALGKLAQAKMYGAEIVEIAGNFDEALNMVREAGEGKVAVVNSVNPYRLEGQKTIAFEAIEQLGQSAGYFRTSCRQCRQYFGGLERVQRICGAKRDGYAETSGCASGRCRTDCL